MQTNGAVRPIVRKKAALVLLRLMRKSPPDAELLQPEVWSVKLVGPLSVSSLMLKHTCHLMSMSCVLQMHMPSSGSAIF